MCLCRNERNNNDSEQYFFRSNFYIKQQLNVFHETREFHLSGNVNSLDANVRTFDSVKQKGFDMFRLSVYSESVTLLSLFVHMFVCEAHVYK